jgi:hypothetical protein
MLNGPPVTLYLRMQQPSTAAPRGRTARLAGLRGRGLAEGA